MLSILAFAILACAVVIGVVFSSENLLALFAAVIGFLLFPLAVIVTLLSVGLSALGSAVPAAGEWGALLGTYVDGGYGFPGLYYLVGGAVLWFTAIFIYGDEDAGADETSTNAGDTSESKKSDKGDVDSSDSGPENITEFSDVGPGSTDLTEIDGLGNVAPEGDESSEGGIQDLTDLSGVGPKGAKRLREAGFESVSDLKSASVSAIADVEGLGTKSARALKSQLDETDEVYDTDRVQAEPLTSISGVGHDRAEALRNAGYSTPDDVARASQSELGDIVGFSLAARIKADVDGLEVESEDSETDTAADASGESKGNAEDSERETEAGAADSESDQPAEREAQTTDEDETTEEKEYEPLTAVSGVRSDKAKELYEAGYESVEDLRNARQTELAMVVGNALGARIKADVGYPGEEDDESESTDQTQTADQKSGSSRSSGSTSRGIDDEQIEHLLELSDVDRTQAEALYRQGFRTTEDLRTASSSDLADVVGHGTAVSIREEIGYVETSSNTTSTSSRTQSSEVKTSHGQDEAEADGETESEDQTQAKPDSDSEPSTSESTDADETEKQLETEKQAVESQLAEATSDPFSDPESTREQLIRSHKTTAELAESAAEHGREDILEFAEQTLTDIEERLETLSEVRDPLQSARARVPPGQGPSDSISTSELESARESYRSAIDSADEAGFDTTSLEREHDEISAAIERREEHAADASADEDDQADQGSSSTQDETSTDTEESGPHRDDLLDALRSVDTGTDGYPTPGALRINSSFEPDQYYDEFGSWDEALAAAGIDKRQRLLDELRRVAEKIGGVPDITDVDKHSGHSSGTYSSVFGSWNNALAEAGLDELASAESSETKTDTSDGGDTNVEDSDSVGDAGAGDDGQRGELISELQQLDEEWGSIDRKLLYSVSEYHPDEFREEFGSLDAAKDAAGIGDSLETDSGSQQDTTDPSDEDDGAAETEADPTRAELISELQQLDDEWNSIDRKLLYSVGEYSPDAFRDVFGSVDAAKDAAGVGDAREMGSESQQSTTDASDDGDRETETETDKADPSRAGYIEAIKRVAESTDRVVKSTDVSEQSPYSVQEIVRTFGSWQDALDAAGVDNERRLLQELRRLADELGHEPSTIEMNEHGHVSASMYADYFGTYSNAVSEAFSNDDGPDGRDADDTGDSDTATAHASFATIDDITEDRRLDEQIAVQVRKISTTTGDRKDASVRVADLDGTQCWLNVWKKHGVDVTWQEDDWYVLDEVRGKQWTNNQGETKRQLSSTKDLQVKHVGTEPPTDRSEKISTPGPVSSDTGQAGRESDDGDDDQETADDILEDVISEFEEISESS